MPRFHLPALLVALLAVHACSVAEPVYAPYQGSPRARSVVGGKGRVAPHLRARAPLSLTASDGSGLTLVALQATALATDPVALTELELRFANPRDNSVEGKFEIVLPPGADITRFAMLVDGDWQEAEVVERHKGRGAYESALYEQRDPALLEQERGNVFSGRVFPIRGRAQVEFKVSYTQTFSDPAQPYRLSLAGLPVVDALDARVGVAQSGSDVVQWTERHLRGKQPIGDIVVDRKTTAVAAWRVGDRVVARVAVPGVGEIVPPQSLAILFDTSASRAPGFTHKVAQMTELVTELRAEIDPAASLEIRAFDQTVTSPLYRGPISGFDASKVAAALLERRALGASNLARVLGVAATNAAQRVVLFTDGMVTAGARKPAALGPKITAMADAGVQRLDVVAGPGLRDDALVQALVHGGFARDGVVIDGALPAQAMARRVLRRSAPPLTVCVENAPRSWPKTVRGVQGGDGILVFAQVPESVSTLEMTISAEGQPPQRVRVPIASTDSELIAQAWRRSDVEQRIAALLDDEAAAADVEKLAALSVKHRLVNELTALVVLESALDYARFGIARQNTWEVLSVERDAVVAQDTLVWASGRVISGPHSATQESSTRSETENRFEFLESTVSGDASPPPEPPRTPDAALQLDSTPGLAADPDPGFRPAVRTPAGMLARVQQELDAGYTGAAAEIAWAWRDAAPSDLMALIAVGNVAEAQGRPDVAARAFASIAELHPTQAPMLRSAAVRLEPLGRRPLALAIDLLREAERQRPDHPSSHRALAWALARAGRFERAFAALGRGYTQQYPQRRFASARDELAAELQIMASAWLRARPGDKRKIDEALAVYELSVARQPSLRFVLTWETDANDVDLHIRDGQGGHAWYDSPQLGSGGSLLADVRNGFGPESFVIEGAATAQPYDVAVHYYARGPMGFGMGRVHVVAHDGAGNLEIRSAPFVVMQDKAMVDLGEI